MLPGQRKADRLKTEVSATVCSVSPNIFRCDTRLGPIYLQTHVDDIEYVGMLQAVDECLIPAMEKCFKISNRSIIKAGDEMDFLKRKHVLRPDGSLLIMAHPKHCEKLCQLLGIDPQTCGKKCPLMPGYTEVDTSSLLKSRGASVYRTCIGILLYLAYMFSGLMVRC